jgi:hypothetical protein
LDDFVKRIDASYGKYYLEHYFATRILSSHEFVNLGFV